MNNKQLFIGWAQIDITPDRPVLVAGQLYTRVSSYVHDPVTATALAIDNEDAQCILVSLDMVSPPDHVSEILIKRLQLDGFDNKNLSFNVIHTHNSSMFGHDSLRESNERILGKEICPDRHLPDNILMDDEAAEFLYEKLDTLITNAWEARRPGGISYALDYAAIAFNRRPVFDLGNGKTESKMYGVCSQDNFLRFEGTVDHTADMLYTWDLEGNLTGVAVDIPCPSQVYELHRFLSADYWGPARDCIREELGNIYILPLCGAGGDQNPLDLVRLSKTNVQELKEWNAQAGEVFRNFDMALECRDIGERICEAVVRGYRKARNNIQTNAVFKHTVVKMELPIRFVTESDFREASAQLKVIKDQFAVENKMTWVDIVKVFEPLGVVLRWELQQETKIFSFDIHVLRIGEAALATNPFELFVDYGMRIKARCKAQQAFIVQLANGKGGYLPTVAAVNGGSYSSKPASTICGPDSGDLLVERTIAAINALWQ